MFSVRAGLISAVVLWVGFVLTTMTVNNAFTMRKPTLTVIDSLHWLGGDADHGRDHRRMGLTRARPKCHTRQRACRLVAARRRIMASATHKGATGKT